MKFGLINPVGKQTIKNIRVHMIVHHLFLFRLLIGVFLNIHMGRKEFWVQTPVLFKFEFKSILRFFSGPSVINSYEQVWAIGLAIK